MFAGYPSCQLNGPVHADPRCRSDDDRNTGIPTPSRCLVRRSTRRRASSAFLRQPATPTRSTWRGAPQTRVSFLIFPLADFCHCCAATGFAGPSTARYAPGCPDADHAAARRPDPDRRQDLACLLGTDPTAGRSTGEPSRRRHDEPRQGFSRTGSIGHFNSSTTRPPRCLPCSRSYRESLDASAVMTRSRISAG